MLQQKPLAFGNLVGTVYDFPEAGNVLPMHVHDEAGNHISIVAKGAFRAHGDGWELMLFSGNVVDWPAGQAHEFVALEADSRIVNIVKGAK